MRYELEVIGSTHISVNLFLRAGESSRLPKSPLGSFVRDIEREITNLTNRKGKNGSKDAKIKQFI